MTRTDYRIFDIVTDWMGIARRSQAELGNEENSQEFRRLVANPQFVGILANSATILANEWFGNAV